MEVKTAENGNTNGEAAALMLAPPSRNPGREGGSLDVPGGRPRAASDVASVASSKSQRENE